MPTDDELVDQLNASKPPANETIGGTIRSVDQQAGTAVFEFTPTGNVVNAADFIGAAYFTQMLDQACAIAGIAHTGRVPTALGIKTSCLRALGLDTYGADRPPSTPVTACAFGPRSPASKQAAKVGGVTLGCPSDSKTSAT